MAMFPNATKGYMPFVPPGKAGKNKRSRGHHHVNGGKLHRTENRHSTVGGGGPMKMYQITLKDKKGVTYKYIVKTDGSKSLPELTQSKITLKASHSMPNVGYPSPDRQRKILAEKQEALQALNVENFSTSLDLRDCGKKEGIFSSIIRFIKEKTGKSEKTKKSGKSKRKPKDFSQRKRQRTVSAMSNLDPIQESPNEHEYECDEDDDDDLADTDSYTHYSGSISTDSDSSSVDSSSSSGSSISGTDTDNDS